MENRNNSGTTERLLELLGDEPVGQTSDGLPIYASESPYPKVNASGRRGGNSLAEKCREIAQRAPDQPRLTLEERITVKKKGSF